VANKALLTEPGGTPKQIVFANHADDFSPSTNNNLQEGTPTEGELVLLNLADSAAAQSAKVDLGEKFAQEYAVIACLEMQLAAAVDGALVEFYWNASTSGTAAVADLAGATGAAGAYSGYSSDLATSILQLIPIGSMVMTDDAFDSIQIAFVGTLYPPSRYGSLIIKNECGQTICDTDDIEAHVVLNPVVPELQ
jgi:hypothetical protein